MIIYFPFIFFSGFQGLAVFPFIFVKHKYMKDNPQLMNHEKIHLRQQIEMLFFLFFLFYFAEFFINLLKYRNGLKAYKEISFEKEAYANDHNLQYLKTRRFWNFLKYYR